ncbi:AEC family transporter [Streptococcus caballi]|uniref:AEC family transporter n=1 Tax=Streptococcus caballi TaxID=439220 RepID=UPI00035CD641|nr:AEC family transporter [Streptococcus caballi]
MAVFLHSISGVLIILVMIAIGYWLNERGWFDEQAASLMTKLVTQLALPAYMIYTIMARFSAKELLEMLPQLHFPALSMVILLGIAAATAQLFAVDRKHRGLFISMFFNSNTVFVGLPINQALFGDKSIPYVLVYYMCNTTFFWTIGTYLIQKDGQKTANIDWRSSLRKIFSPPLLGFILGVLLVVFKVKLPDFLMSDLQYIGNLTIPLSMLFIGLTVSRAGLSQLALKKDHMLILFGRFVISPLLMTLIVWQANLPHLMKEVFIIQSAMPVMTNAPIIARMYDVDTDYAAVMVTETTLLTMLVVPILTFLVSTI